MKKKVGILLFGVLIFSSCGLLDNEQASAKYRLWADQPAKRFEESFPLGNGRLGMMPDGGIAKETIVLNDITLWSGCVTDNSNPEAASALPEIRELLKQGKNEEAQRLVYKTFACSGGGSSNPRYGSFQILGNLKLTYQYDANSEKVTDYKRDLVLDNAMAHTSFTLNGVNYSREYLTSFSDDVMIVRLKADKKGKLSFTATLDRPERFVTQPEGDALLMQGELNSGAAGIPGMKYAAIMKIQTDGKQTMQGNVMEVHNASTATLYLSAATNFRGVDQLATSKELLLKVSKVNYTKELKLHSKKFQALFDRADVNFGVSKFDSLTTLQRLNAFYKDNTQDPFFAALYFQYGRYLLISSTRTGLLPPNLQGLWSNTIQTPWNGDYHMNINVQMNHWPVEMTNLAELHEPFIEQTKSLVKPGEETARVFYKAQGWVAHMMTNVWGFTEPGESPSWGATNTGGGWNCEHLWDHYAYNMDKEYLKSVYPVLKGACDFFLSMLTEEPKNGWLVTAPSSSPENAYLLDGKALNVCMGPTMDNQIIRELFTNTAAAAKILGVDAKFCEDMETAKAKLPPHQIGKYGQLMEWLEDYEETDIHHRHVSHLYGLHPSNQITPTSTPELAAAARVTLKRRGDSGTGWSRAWKVNFWARLADGNHAYKMLTELLHPVSDGGYNYSNGGGSYPNLFDAHPPFQIDGNFGGCSGIAEMLLQSHAGFIEYLPALPDALSNGSFHGLRVRGGAETDATWENGTLKQIELRATADNTFKIKLPFAEFKLLVNGKEDKKIVAEDGYIQVSLKKGDRLNVSLTAL
jgi:alpha-L-fucosidase 2